MLDTSYICDIQYTSSNMAFIAQESTSKRLERGMGNTWVMLLHSSIFASKLSQESGLDSSQGQGAVTVI